MSPCRFSSKAGGPADCLPQWHSRKPIFRRPFPLQVRLEARPSCPLSPLQKRARANYVFRRHLLAHLCIWNHSTSCLVMVTIEGSYFASSHHMMEVKRLRGSCTERKKRAYWVPACTLRAACLNDDAILDGWTVDWRRWETKMDGWMDDWVGPYNGMAWAHIAYCSLAFIYILFE